MAELVHNSVSSNILLYKTAQGEARIEVIFNSETFWMSQKRMADLYNVDVSTINYHLKEIFKSGELNENSVIRKIPITANDGKDYNTLVYNLDAIIAVGYRVNSYQATQFRIWATFVLKEFIIKGYALDDERLKQGKHFGRDYFDDLLERIREIRTSERRYYQKITDIYAECSADYDAKSENTKLFFKMVQNMMHLAVFSLAFLQAVNSVTRHATRTSLNLSASFLEQSTAFPMSRLLANVPQFMALRSRRMSEKSA